MIGLDAHDPDRRPQQLGRAFPVKTGPAPTLATSILAPKLEAMAEAQAGEPWTSFKEEEQEPRRRGVRAAETLQLSFEVESVDLAVVVACCAASICSATG